MHYKAARAFTFGEKCLHYGLRSMAIFIHYLACFVCIVVEREEALFCLASCLPLTGQQAAGRFGYFLAMEKVT